MDLMVKNIKKSRHDAIGYIQPSATLC